jgi:dihydroorotate dehydrogenase (fumarate)
VDVPVIASLNATSAGGWVSYARLMQDAGADALELNLYHLAADPTRTGADMEALDLELIGAVRAAITIPLAVKLSPYYSALASFARRAVEQGADGLVLFNRFYQPDIDIQHLTAVPRLELSHHEELRLRLRWLAILHGRVRASLALTGGIETPADGIKAILAGAHAVQVVSAVLRHGPEYIQTMQDGLVHYMEWQELTTLDEMRGRVSLSTVADAEAFERANYIRALHSWPA